MISISTLTIAWAVCGRKTFFLCFSLILLCRFHSALFFFFFDYSLKKNQTSLMGQILLRPSLLSKRWKEKRLEHIVTIQGDFLASELLCFQLLLRSIRTVIFWQVSLVVLSSLALSLKRKWLWTLMALLRKKGLILLCSHCLLLACSSMKENLGSLPPRFVCHQMVFDKASFAF